MSKVISKSSEVDNPVIRSLLFFGQSVKQMVVPPISFYLLLKQMEFVGNRSLGIIIFAGGIVGAVFGLQLGEIFQVFDAESMIGAAATFALSKELAPVVGSFLVTARAGSAMAAEIATMRINEQIDALKVMAINPIAYLVSPRILASVIIMPFLTAVFLLSGVVVSFITGVYIFDVDVGVFIDNISWLVGPVDVRQGMEKSIVFGAIFSTVGCYKGFYASGGAKGVGKATTEAVVISLVAILISDFFLSYLQYQSNYPGLTG